MSNNSKTTFPCFVEMYNACTKDTEKSTIRAQYVLQLYKSGIPSDEICSLLLLNGLIDSDSEECNRFISECIKNTKAIDCRKLYQKIGGNTLLCDLCIKNSKNVNKFKNQEFSLLLQCLVSPDVINTIKEINTTTPLFRCIECDDVYLKSKNRDIRPSYAIPFTSLFFDEVIVNKVSKDNFLEKLVNIYGEGCRASMHVLSEKLFTMKNGATRPPLSNKKVTDIIEEIINYFYPENEENNNNKTETENVIKKDNNKKNSILTRDNTPEERKKSDSKQKNDSSTSTKQATDFNTANSTSFDKKSSKSCKEITKGITSVEEKPKRNFMDEDSVTKDESLDKINSTKNTEAEPEKEEDDFTIKNNGPVCTYESVIDEKSIDKFQKIEEKDINTIVEHIKNDKFVACEYFKVKNVDCIVFYIKSNNRFIIIPTELFTDELLSVMRSQTIIKCTGKPWMLVDSIYKNHNIVCRNVYSLYTMTLITTTSLRFSIYDIVYNNAKTKDTLDNQTMYILKYSKAAFDNLMNIIISSNKDKLLEIYSNFDIMIGCSLDACLKNTGEKVINFNSNGLYHIRNNEMLDKMNSLPFKLKVEVEKDNKPDAIIAELLATYVLSGYMAKCNLSIISKSEDSVIFIVDGEDEYEYVFEMLIYLSHLISFNKGIKCNIQFIPLQ